MPGVRTPSKRRNGPIKRMHSPLFYHSDDFPELANFVRTSHELLNKVQQRPKFEEKVLSTLQNLQPFNEKNKKLSDVRNYLRSLVVCVIHAENPHLKEFAAQILNNLCQTTRWRETCQRQDGFVSELCKLCFESKQESLYVLLSLITTDYKLDRPISEVKPLILHLVATIRGADIAKDKDKNSEIIHGLRILANLVHLNLELKLVVTDYPEYDQLLKNLVKFIRHTQGCIDALQFLVFLVLNTDREKEFFKEKNLHSTLQIVFSKLGNQRDVEVVKKCIIILTKLLNDSTDIMVSLESFNELEGSLCKILELSVRKRDDYKMKSLSIQLLLVLLRSQQCQKILIHIFSSKPELSRLLLEDVFSSSSLDLQIICRKLLRKILQSKHSGLEQAVKSEYQFCAKLLQNTEFIDQLVRSLCNQIHTTKEGINHSFGVAKTSEYQTAIRELVELIAVLCHRKEFRRKLAGSLQIEDVEALLSRDTLCKYTSLTFPLINLLFQIRKEMPQIKDRFDQLVEDVHVLKICGQCLSSKKQFEVREALLFLRECFSTVNEGRVKQLDMLAGIAKEIHSSNKEIKGDIAELALRQNEAYERSQKYKDLYNRTHKALNKAKTETKTKVGKKDEEIQALERKHAVEIESLQKELSEQEKSNNDQIVTLQNENENLEKERRRLADLHERQQQELRDQELKIKELDQSCKQKTDKMQDIILKEQEEKQKRDKLQTQIRHLESKNNQLSAEKREVENLIDEYKKKMALIARHYKKLQNDYNQVEDEKRAVQRKHVQAKSSVTKLEKEKKEMKQEGDMRKAEIKSLKQKVSEQDSDLKELEEDCEDLEKKNNLLNTTIAVMMEAAQKHKNQPEEGGRRRKRRKRNQVAE